MGRNISPKEAAEMMRARAEAEAALAEGLSFAQQGQNKIAASLIITAFLSALQCHELSLPTPEG